MIPRINPRRQQGRTEESRDEEMSLTIKQRLASTKKLNLPQIVQPQHKREMSHHKLSAAGLDHSSLQPCPAEVVFQNYSPGEVCEMPVVLRNRDKVPHLVKVILESSPYFQLEIPSDAHRKVPPGLSMTVHILFTPGQNKDYFHQFLCITEREEFIVPIRAIGARAILDFPGQLHFSECPVKYSTEKTLLVQNRGNRAAHYQLSTQRQYPRLCQQDKDKLSDFLKECRVDTTRREHSALLTRTLQRVRAKVQEDPMLFYDDIFCLEPKEGEIWPKCSAEISVFFKPQEARVYNQAVYCDISAVLNAACI